MSWRRGIAPGAAKYFLGGLHAQSCPDEVAPHADAMAIGDGVQLWPEILRDIEQGRLKPRYEATYERPYALDPCRGGICCRAEAF